MKAEARQAVPRAHSIGLLVWPGMDTRHDQYLVLIDVNEAGSRYSINQWVGAMCVMVEHGIYEDDPTGERAYAEIVDQLKAEGKQAIVAGPGRRVRHL